MEKKNLAIFEFILQFFGKFSLSFDSFAELYLIIARNKYAYIQWKIKKILKIILKTVMKFENRSKISYRKHVFDWQ